MQTLLESEALVDSVNNSGSTPFFLATEGLHKTASLVGLEDAKLMGDSDFSSRATVYTRTPLWGGS